MGYLPKDDTDYWELYSRLMAEEPDHLILKLETKDPIELGAFVGEFTSLANQYDKFVRANYPDLSGETEMFVSQVREGSIVAELIPKHLLPLISAAGGLGLTAVVGMHYSMVIEDFVKRWSTRLGVYFETGGRDPEASKSDLKDFHGTLAAIANDPSGIATIQAATFEDGKKKIRAEFKFTSQQARRAEEQIENHKRELDKPENADFKRVLMTFVRSDIRESETGKRSGELVVIERIGPKPLALVYASSLAEERIKFEIRDKDSVYKKGFDVDVNVETRGGRPVAYRVTALHNVVDLPDES